MPRLDLLSEDYTDAGRGVFGFYGWVDVVVECVEDFGGEGAYVVEV